MSEASVACKFIVDERVDSLASYFGIIQSVLDSDREYWFRGVGKLSFALVPSALRPKSPKDRTKALSLVDEMKRLIEMKVTRPPSHDDKIGWIQVAQHFGLPTRLLDWTLNAAAALYFSCQSNSDADGAVFALDPCELNALARNGDERILNPRADTKRINAYLELDGNRVGQLKTVAIKPTFNTERIILQQGAFTLHGSRNFAIGERQAPSLIGVPIFSEFKPVLMKQLDRIGVSEMTLFPEPEHVCSDIRRRANL